MKEKKAAREAAEIEETKKQEKVCVCRSFVYDFAWSAWKTKGRPENAHDLVSAYLSTYNVARTHQLIVSTAAAHSLTTSRPPSLRRSHTHCTTPSLAPSLTHSLHHALPRFIAHTLTASRPPSLTHSHMRSSGAAHDGRRSRPGQKRLRRSPDEETRR
jgi:hypothetical protein